LLYIKNKVIYFIKRYGMKKVLLNNYYYEYGSQEELDHNDRSLMEEAIKAVEKAYAPYSNYSVGAALLLDNGKVVIGNNQENVAYPSGMCAERVALYYASANYPDVPIKAMAVTVKSKTINVDSPITPCGSCRQVFAEYENRFNNKIRLILKGDTGKVFIAEGIEHLLPLIFKANELKK
jgi:cytidine deaminase